MEEAKYSGGTDEIEEDAMAGCGVCKLTPDKAGLIGEYDYKYLCTPSMPWTEGGVNPPVFMKKDAKIGLVLSMVMGLQHALAMVAGIATPPRLIANDACFPWQQDQKLCDLKTYLINAAWFTSGLLTIIQVFRAKLGGTGYYLGTGLISVMGTSFTFLPIAREMIVGEIMASKADCYDTSEDPGLAAYGKFLGTCMVAAFFEIILGLLPPKVIKKLFPDVVCGTTVMLIGGGLIGAGIKYLGGGVFCGENDMTKAPRFGGPQLCDENGAVVLAFGAMPYVMLGLVPIFASIFIQMFGSPFLKSTFIFWALIIGSIVSMIYQYTAQAGDWVTCATRGDDIAAGNIPCIGGATFAVEGEKYSFWDTDLIESSSWFTFIGMHEHPIFGNLGFAPEYFLPILIGFFVSSAETIGDIGMSCIASRLPTEGADYNSRIQGGLLADGVNSLIAGILGAPPNTTFSQNNGVIALTRCASRAAGFGCAFWLMCFGVIGKLGALFASIPICVVGGMVLQCFTMVFVAGMQMATSKKTRRNSFILMISLGLGLGVAMMPNLFEGGGGKSFYAGNLKFNHGFWPEKYTCDTFYEVKTFKGDAYSPATCTPAGVGATPVACTGGANGKTREFSQPYRASLTSIDVDFTDCETLCTAMNGTFTAAVPVMFTPKAERAGEACRDMGGACCSCYDKWAKARRTAVILMLKTPYCIGFLAAVILNLIMPEDKLDEYSGEVIAPAEDNKVAEATVKPEQA
jgi:NCS2 family nucleobase:cation symporter-2